MGADLSTAQGSLPQREGELGGRGTVQLRQLDPPPADPFPVPTLEVY